MEPSTLLSILVTAVTAIVGTILAVRRWPFEQQKTSADAEKSTAEADRLKLENLVRLADQLEAALVDKVEYKRRLTDQDAKLAELEHQLKELQAELIQLKKGRADDAEVIKAERTIRQRVEADLNAARETQVRYELRLRELEEENERLRGGQSA